MNTAMKAMRALLCGLVAVLWLPAFATTTDIYYHNDLAGTPLAATDASGNLLWRQGYKPYGERLDPKAPAEQQPWFTGKAHVEAAGLSYFGARWYDPQLGRFMGVDPRGFDEANVHSFNRYAYANNNPYRFVDPDGREGIETLYMSDHAPIVVAGRAFGGLAAFGVGALSGNAALKSAAIDGMAESRQSNLETLGVLATLRGGGKKAEAASGETKFTIAGRRAHQEEPLPPGFERDVNIPGTRLRMDGYNKGTKEIVEIKPDNARAVARGEMQLDGYCRACNESALGAGHSARPVQTYSRDKYIP